MQTDSPIDKRQKQLLDTEMLILVNPEDKVVGTDTKMNCHMLDPVTEEAPLHRAFSLYLFNNNDEFLLTQRAATKIVSPLRFTNTCCSHPRATAYEAEEKDYVGVKRAACRRLREELGVPEGSVTPQDLTCLKRFHYEVKSTEVQGFGEHEIYYLLVCCVKDDVFELCPDPNEIHSVRYVKREEFDELKRQLSSNELVATAWFKHIALNHLERIWDHLDSLDELCTPGIQRLDLPDL